MKPKRDRRSLCGAAIPAVLFALYVLLDYLNVPHRMGFSIDRINMDFFNVFLNSVIVVVLYLCTYCFVDRRQIRKDENAKNTADILLLYTYKECLDNLSVVTNAKMVERYIIPKVDGNKIPEENKVIWNLQNFPFEYKGEILELSKDGYVEKEVLNRYFYIQKEYKYVVTMKIILFDLTSPQTMDQQALYMEIKKEENDLKSLLNHEIERLEQIETR